MTFVKWDDVEDQVPTTPEGQRKAESAIEAQVTGYMLRQLRKQEGFSQAEIAGRMRISQRRVSAIERGDMARTEVHTIVSYVRALGGSVRLAAEVDGETTVIADFASVAGYEAVAR